MAKDRRYLKPEEVYRIYRENGPYIYQVIKSRLADPSKADDVFQRLFLRLLQKPIPRGMKNQRAYLCRMAINIIIDEALWAKAYKRRISRHLELQLYATAADGPYEKIIQADEVDAIMHIIDNYLPDHTAATLKLRYKKNYSNSEIARATSVKKNTVIKRTSQGLKKLREIIERNRLGHGGCVFE